MRPLLPLLGISFLLVVATYSSLARADDQDTNIAERDKWWAEAVQHANAHEIAEAIAAGEKALAIDRASIKNEEFIAFYLRWLGTWYVEVGNYPAARQAREEQLALQIKLKGQGHWSVADVHWALRDIDRLSKSTDAQRQENARLEGMYAAKNKAARQGDFQTAKKLTFDQLAGWRKLLPDPTPSSPQQSATPDIFSTNAEIPSPRCPITSKRSTCASVPSLPQTTPTATRILPRA